MKFFSCAVLIAFTFITSTSSLFSQPNNIIDSIEQKMYWNALHQPSATLFVHFDKNIYTNRETAWFTGYVLKNQAKNEVNVMSVALIRNDDRSVLADTKFVIEKGRAQGNIFIPDSLPAGNYSFICYTDGFINSKPTDVFIQPVTIKTVNDNGFIAKLNFDDVLNLGMDSIKVRLQAYTKDVSLVKGANVVYYIGNRDNPFKTGRLKTDNFGEAAISIPLKQITPANNVFQAEISMDKEVKTFSLQLPVYKRTAIVKFFPEGGNLVDGQKSTVGWEVVNNEGTPLEVTGFLYKDNKQIATITTNANGIGKFTLTPLDASVYTVKLQTIQYAKDSVYTLPVVAHAGPVVVVEHALANDTLVIDVNNKQIGSRWIAIVHNYRRIIATVNLISNGQKLVVKVPLNGVPKGVYTFTLLDTLARPWAERLFFAHYNDRAKLIITKDSSSYSTRQQVGVKLKVTDAFGSPIVGLFSIAAVKDNRFDPKKIIDIESYLYLSHELSSLPFKKGVMNSDVESAVYLENLLLVKGWRRYKWQELESIRAADTIQTTSKVVFEGNAYIPKKPVKKPLKLTLLKKPRFDAIITDSTGNFTIAQEKLFLQPEQHIKLFVNDENQAKYTITVKDLYKEWNKNIGLSIPLPTFNEMFSEQTTLKTLVSKDELPKQLLDVKVITKKSMNIYGNACGDYVCIANVLNCPNHTFGGTEPIVGVRYNTGRGRVLYEGCEGLKYITHVDGIYTRKEFYVPNYGTDENTLNEELASTLYWNHSQLTNNSGEASFTFYTNDLTGKFRIVIQGITDGAGVVYGEQFFEVKMHE